MEAVDLLESVGEPTGRQLVGAEPSAEVGERPSNAARAKPIKANLVTMFFQPPVLWTFVGYNTLPRVMASSP